MANPIESELWRIYSFYSLHSDPTLPEQLKVPSFIRFAKDCQIVSKKLKGAQIELEIARVARSRRVQQRGDYNPSYSLSFVEFLSLLELLSQKVHTNVSPEIALRKLLLENVLLLASRRVPFSVNADVKCPEAVKVLRETCGKALQNIFDHYVHVAETRRNLLAASEVARRYKEDQQSQYISGTVPPPPTGGSVSSQSTTLSSQKHLYKDLISYKEYIQFCHDFSLRSTALLTAIQVGEIFLNCVPLDPATRSLKHMNFETFCVSLLHMAAIAYRDCDPVVPMQNKVKALLLFMWKHVNNREKIAEVARSRVRVLISSAGSLNMFGSGLFSDSFLALWQSEGFQTYTDPSSNNQRENGSQFLKKVTKGSSNEFLAASGVHIGAKVTLTDLATEDDDKPETDSGEESDKDSTAIDEAVHHEEDQGDENRPADTDEPSRKSTATEAANREKKKTVPKPRQVIRGYQIAALFAKRPELSEFLYLEIENMRLAPHSHSRSHE